MTSVATAGAIEDLGPANQSMFPLMSGLQVGSDLFIGSRNLKPSCVLRFDLAARKVTQVYELGPGKFVQALATGDGHIYAGIVGAKNGEPNLFALDPDTGHVVAEADLPGLFVRTLAVAPDGAVFAAGKENEPKVWKYQPKTGEVSVLAVPDPNATQSRAIVATEDTVYFGSGSNLAGGAGASGARTFAIDRATGEVSDIQPVELADDTDVRSLAVAEGLLLIGTQGHAGSCHLAVVDLAEKDKPQIFTIEGKSAGFFHRSGESVYFGAKQLYRYDLKTREVHKVSDDGPSERWALGSYDGRIISVSAFGGVRYIELPSAEHEYVDLIEAGAPQRPQLGMSLAIGESVAFVGGNGGVVRHDLSGREPMERMLVPGEAKSMEVVGDDLYLAVYNSMGLWKAPGGRNARQVAPLPPEQNRPQDTAWHSPRELLVAGTQNDTEGGGALCLYSPESAAVVLHENPFDNLQMVRAVALRGDSCVFGGWNRYDRGPRGEVGCIDLAAAWDEKKLSWRWRVDPELGAGISCLAMHPNTVVGITMAGLLFALDAKGGALVATKDVSGLVPEMSRMVATGGRIYAGSDTCVFEVGPNLEVTLIADDLDGQWYSGPKIAADSHGNLYTLRGRNLVRITPPESQS